MSQSRPQQPRRNNAPIRPPRRPATTVPDLLIALATAAAVMAVSFFVASFFNDSVTAGEAGKLLARIFAGLLLVSAVFLLMLALLLLRDEVRRADHYVLPVSLGTLIGALEVVAFLWPAESFIFAPFLLLVFVFRPVRRMGTRLLGRGA